MKTTIAIVTSIALDVPALGPCKICLSIWFEHGVKDAKSTDWYILQPGNGFQFHSWDFVRGYVNGFCSGVLVLQVMQIRQVGTV